MKKRIGIVCMALGALLLTGAVLLFLWNQEENAEAVKKSQLVLQQMDDIIEEGKAKDKYQEGMTEKMIDGHAYIGYLSIPSLNLCLPVMAEWDYEKLQIAPCRYFGTTYTKDMVIAAHNYYGHFGTLKNLKLQDELYFTDMNGEITRYEVAEVVVMNPVEVENMIESEYELSLFTCTYGGNSRLTVRCLEIK